MIEQRILDALNEAPGTKQDLIDTLDDLSANLIARTLRRLANAKEIELVATKRGVQGHYKALVQTTKLKGSVQSGVTSAAIWNPATDPRPAFLQAMREGREA